MNGHQTASAGEINVQYVHPRHSVDYSSPGTSLWHKPRVQHSRFERPSQKPLRRISTASLHSPLPRASACRRLRGINHLHTDPDILPCSTNQGGRGSLSGVLQEASPGHVCETSPLLLQCCSPSGMKLRTPQSPERASENCFWEVDNPDNHPPVGDPRQRREVASLRSRQSPTPEPIPHGHTAQGGLGAPSASGHKWVRAQRKGQQDRQLSQRRAMDATAGMSIFQRTLQDLAAGTSTEPASGTRTSARTSTRSPSSGLKLPAWR